MDFCDGSPDYASGGYIGDSDLNGTVTNGSQQQYFTQNTTIDSWSNAVWNQVFCGDPGAPAQSFASNSGDSGGPNSYTTLATCPVSEQEPYLYQDSSGNYNVFVPSVQTNTSGTDLDRERQHPGHLALGEQHLLRRQLLQHDHARSTRRWPRATTCCSPRASTATPRRSTSRARTPRSSASASRP